MTISLLLFLVLILGFFLIQGTQLFSKDPTKLFSKDPTNAAIQEALLRDIETSSDFGSDNGASSDFGSLGVPWCQETDLL